MKNLKINDNEFEFQPIARKSNKLLQTTFSRRFIVRLCLFAISGLQVKEQFEGLALDKQSSTQGLKKPVKTKVRQKNTKQGNKPFRSNPTPSPSLTPTPEPAPIRGFPPTRNILD
ncbi:hypothetical protein [Nostoc sp.]|uniref:hypothetical protein n=1 Tax=Nostoc sp. TaxID=1180 RepID=UPI002FFC44C4